MAVSKHYLLCSV